MIVELIYIAATIFGISLALFLYFVMRLIKEKKDEQIP